MKYLDKKFIKIGLKGSDKKSFLKEVCSFFAEGDFIASEEVFFESIWSREETMTTGMGHNVAIPHGRSETVTELKLFVATIPEGIDYESFDDEPVYLMFMSAVPKEHNGQYMKFLGKISEMVRNQEVKEKLISSKTSSEIYNIMREYLHED